MGICLDTDANSSQEAEDPGADWKGGGRNRSSRIRTSLNAAMMQNTGKIKFDPPKVPVIFVLGGPGSGKVTHCDTLMQERRGVTHINMMDLLQQYALGNDMQDFSQISSKAVTEVLMLEMKMAPAAKVYLISGYPRSMRDVVEYSEKIQVINGVILISWRQSVLQKQIDYGAKLGHVVLSLAKMELENFFKNVMPVADYFDQSDLLIAVNGERAPQEVYKDFRAAVLDILEALENQEAILNGVTGMGRGINDIPGSIVSVDTAPSQRKNITEMTAANTSATTASVTSSPDMQHQYNDQNDPSSLMGQNIDHYISRGPQLANVNYMNSNSEIPPIIWVIGGPGSNKSNLCMKSIGLNQGWGHFSIGRLLRTITDTAPRANTESYAVKEALSAGEMVPEKAINSLLETNIQYLKDKTGIIIDGYPRNMAQAKYFEDKYKQRPPIVLLDCSKLQLGRGRIDDTVSSFRRRLELFREQTLPMLKILDSSNRLTIVDGDTDSPSVQREFEKVIRSHIQQLMGIENKIQSNPPPAVINRSNSIAPKSLPIGGGGGGGGGEVPGIGKRTGTGGGVRTDTILEDVEENVPGVVPTISHHVSLANGYLRNNPDGPVKTQMNGNLPNGGYNFRKMLEESEKQTVDTFM